MYGYRCCPMYMDVYAFVGWGEGRSAWVRAGCTYAGCVWKSVHMYRHACAMCVWGGMYV